MPALPDAGALPTNARLPDPFRRLDNSRITTTGDWRCRREEIKRLAEKFVYGEKPVKPQSVTGTVSSSSITVNVNHNGRTASFSASVQLPSGTGPFPAVVVLGGFGADTAAIRAAGAAVINYDPYAVGREGTPRNKQAGRVLQRLRQHQPDGSADGVGVGRQPHHRRPRTVRRHNSEGRRHRRHRVFPVRQGRVRGRAFDQRIALTMPIESGTAGVPIFRGIPGEGAQSLSSAYGEQPWFGDAFGTFTGSPNRLPVDTHEMVAMVAPRGLFVMDNPHIANLGPRSASVAALGGAEVYRARRDGQHHVLVRRPGRHALRQPGRVAHAAAAEHPEAPAAHRQRPRRDAHLQPRAGQPGRVAGLDDAEPRPVPQQPAEQQPSVEQPRNRRLRASVSVNAWTGGFVATIRVTAGAAAINGWTVAMTLPAGASITNSWNTTRTGSSGAVTLANVSFNGRLTAGQSTEFGFQGTGTFGSPTPTCTAS